MTENIDPAAAPTGAAPTTDASTTDAMGGERAANIVRGVTRHFFDLGLSCVLELTLANGRRADIAAIDSAGQITIVEVKSCRTDFMTDGKWQDYLDFCDRFFFAVDSDFPRGILPGETGLILADRYGAAIARDSGVTPLAAARRKAMLLRFGKYAADRLTRAWLAES